MKSSPTNFPSRFGGGVLPVIAAAGLLVFSLPGCGGSSEPAIVADPNEYAPYQASQEEISAQQQEAADQADG